MRNEKLDLLEIMKSGDKWLFLEATDINSLKSCDSLKFGIESK